VWKGYIKNKRKHDRISCTTPICSEVTIIKVNDKKVNTGKTKVCVEDISSGGLKFISSLDLPVNPNIMVSFETIILNQELLFKGIIVRKIEIKSSIFQYGVKFVMEDDVVKANANILNDLDYVISKKIKDTGSNLCIKDKMECLLLSKTKKDQRRYIRFKCPNPLCSKLVLKRINNKIIDSYGDNICIEDIGEGGLSFLSHIDYPVIEDIHYELQVIVLDLRILLRGQIVRKNIVEDKIFKYGLRFDSLGLERSEFKQLLEAIRNSAEDKILFKKSSFCMKDKKECMRTRSNNLKNA
jgi:hypothetical protein